jgi:hypothetical protein
MPSPLIDTASPRPASKTNPPAKIVAGALPGGYVPDVPCSDFTETLEITLDPQGAFRSFSLAKATCSADVGSDRLANLINGRSSEALLTGHWDELIPGLNGFSNTDQFLIRKGLAALQAALWVYHGKLAGGLDDVFTVASIEEGPDFTSIRGFVKVDLAAEKVKPCGGCGRCR